eukprot:evm.model.scf_1452.2 EVM.evm.TU.scf_1452.2   scf_1452:22558-24821(+)
MFSNTHSKRLPIMCWDAHVGNQKWRLDIHFWIWWPGPIAGKRNEIEPAEAPAADTDKEAELEEDSLLSEKSQEELDEALVALAGGAENASTASAVAALLSAGASPDACCTIYGGRALHATAINDNAIAAIALLAAGADPDATDARFGDAPLHDAAVHDAVKVARALLDGGADLDPRDANGETPLHHGAAWGGVGVVAVLLEAGADVGAKGADGRTPGEVVCESLCAPGDEGRLRELLGKVGCTPINVHTACSKLFN